MTISIMDASAIRCFLRGEAPELLPLITRGVIVSDVTRSSLEWELIRFGVKRKDVLTDLDRLGFEVIHFSEQLQSSLNTVLEQVSALEFEPAVAAALARCKFPQGEATLFSGNAVWSNASVSDLKVKWVGRKAQIVPQNHLEQIPPNFSQPNIVEPPSGQVGKP